MEEDALDAPYRRAIAHAHDFLGLDVEQANALAEKLDLTLNVVTAQGWYLGVNVSGRVTVFVRDGVIVGTS